MILSCPLIETICMSFEFLYYSNSKRLLFGFREYYIFSKKLFEGLLLFSLFITYCLNY